MLQCCCISVLNLTKVQFEVQTAARTEHHFWSKVQESTHFIEPSQTGLNGSKPMQTLGFKSPSNGEIYSNGAINMGKLCSILAIKFRV
jgi:hypothetical protein